MNALNELSKILKPDQISQEPSQCAHYGKDWTTYFDIQASSVVFPESTHEVQKIVQWARKNQIQLIPSGGRTGLSGGACATKGEVVISLERMNQVLEFDPIDQTITIQAGYITEALQKLALEKGLFYPVDFAARGSSQIGGNIATNAGGIKVLRYGLTRNWVAGITVVTGAGEILSLNNSLIKNATGLDFRHLFIGSEGILGIICEATIQLTTPPPRLSVLFLAATDLESIMKVYGHFKQSTTLCAFEMLSDLALEKVLAVKGLAKPFAESKAPYYLVLEIENPTDQSEEQILAAFGECLERGWLADGAIATSLEQAKTFWRYREDISESLAPSSPYKNDISVRISKVPALLTNLDQVLSQAYPHFTVVWFGHVGDGNIHINILRPEGMTKEAFVQECRKVDSLIFAEIQKVQGSISAEHGVGLTKKSFLHHTRSREEIALMKNIKSVFDPDGIMNPGKVI